MSQLKPETRILGINDCSFKRDSNKVLVIGTIYRGGKFLDGLISFDVEKDGTNATQNIIKAIKSAKQKLQVQIIMTNGITLAGFNLIDIQTIYKKTKTPVIVVMKKLPNMKKFLSASKKFNKNSEKIVKNAGKIYKIKIKRQQKDYVFTQFAGIKINKVKEIMNIVCINSSIPEPLRVSHIIASGISISKQAKA